MAKNVTLKDPHTLETIYPTTKAEYVFAGDGTATTLMDKLNGKLGPEGGIINGNLIVEGNLTDGINSFVKSNDERLSDKRDPNEHEHTVSDITDFPKNLVYTNDARLSDARDPKAHSHEAADLPNTIVYTDDSRLSDSRDPKSHTHGTSDLPDTIVYTNDARLSDSRDPKAHSHLVTDISNFPTDLVHDDDSRLTDSRTPKAHTHLAADLPNTIVYTDDSRLTDARPASDTTSSYVATGTAPVNGTAVKAALDTLNDTFDEIRAVAAGKTASYVVSNETSAAFKSTDDSIELTSSFKTVDNQTVELASLKLGDNIYVTQTDVPDRFVGSINKTGETISSVTLYKLETTKVDLEPYALSSSLGVVATSNSYNDLDDKPSIPNNTNQLTNGAGFVTKDEIISSVFEFDSTTNTLTIKI